MYKPRGRPPGTGRTPDHQQQLSSNPLPGAGVSLSATSSSATSHSTNLAVAAAAAATQQQQTPRRRTPMFHPGGFVPTPSNAQLAYPGLYHQQKQPDPTLRAPIDVYDMRRDEQRKRPSMMSDFHLAHTQHMGPLSVDISGQRESDGTSAGGLDPRKMGPAYTPQVENISPTPEDQPDAATVTSTAQIAEKLQKVEKVIRGVDSQIKNLEKKKQELELSAAGGSGERSEETEEREQNLFERIYAEGRRKAAASHAMLDKLNGPMSHAVPLYHEPSDTAVYHENQKKFEEFKPRLVQYLRKLQHARQLREKYMTEKYNMMMQTWQKKMERGERHPKRIAKEQRYRELFEKVFPELKKSREEKERLTRTTGTRSGSILGSAASDIEETIEVVTTGPEDEDRKLRQQAVVPPMLLDPRTRARLKYVNNNGLVREPVTEHEFGLDTFLVRWTDEEKRIFKEKILHYGKNFAAIAVFLDRKNTKDCVKFYYLTKKRENYKQLMRKQFKGGRKGKMYRPPLVPRLGDGSKEERKTDVESSDDLPAGKEPEYFCISCKEKIDSASNPGRVLTRACYEQYGLDPQETNPQDVRICQKCRLGIIKKRHNHCPIGTCKTARRRVKPTRPLPPKWKELTLEQRTLLTAQLQIGDESTKCCSGCHKRISRRVEAVLSGEELAENEPPVNNEEESQSAWSEQDVATPAPQKEKHEQTTKPAAAKVPGIESEEEDNSDDEVGLAVIEDSTDSPSVPVKQEVESAEDVNTEKPETNPEIISCDTELMMMKTEAVSESEPKIMELELESESAAEAATSAVVSKLVESLDRDLSRSQESVKSSGESNATLSADEGNSENEAVNRASPKAMPVLLDEKYLGRAATERAASEKGRAASAVALDSLPAVEQRMPVGSGGQIYKPKFRLLEVKKEMEPEPLRQSAGIEPMDQVAEGDLSRSSVPVIVKEERLAAKQQLTITVEPPPEKSESPDIQIIGQKQLLEPPKAVVKTKTPPPSPIKAPQKVSPVTGRPIQGSITHGTPMRQPVPSSVQVPVTGTPVRHSLHPYEGLLRPATPFPLPREEPSRPASTEVSRISPLVFSSGGIAESHLPPHSALQAQGAQVQVQALAQAQQQYRQALSVGYNEQQASLMYHHAYSQFIQQRMMQPNSRQILDDFRTSLQMPHLAGTTEQAQQSALLQQHLYGHHVREEQRRAVESQQRLAQERERLAQEQQRAIALAQAAEHQQRAALLEHQLALAQVANQQYKEHLATAAVAEHHQRALAMAQSEAQRRAFPGLGTGGYMTPGSAPPADVSVKTEPKSPMISPSVAPTRASVGTGISSADVVHKQVPTHHAAVPGSSRGNQPHSVIQETKAEVKKRSETPIISKGAMKEFPPSLQPPQKLPSAQPRSVSSAQLKPSPVAAAAVSPKEVGGEPSAARGDNLSSIIHNLIEQHITPDTPEMKEESKSASCLLRDAKAEKGEKSMMQRIESTIISQFNQDKKSGGVKEEHPPEKLAYDIENVSPVSSPEPEPSARGSPASSIHSERPMSVHSSAGQSQGSHLVYNVFSLPPAVLGQVASDPEVTLAVQSICGGGEEKPGGSGNLTETERRSSHHPDVDPEAAAAVMNLPNYEPLSDEET